METGALAEPSHGGAGGRRQAPPQPGHAVLVRDSTLLLLFVVSVFIPGTFSAGPIQLSLYKLLLLVLIVPLGLRWVTGKAGPIVAADILMLLFCLWQALTLFLHHGAQRIPFIGTTFIETFGAYLLGRTLVRSAADYRAFFRYFLGCLLVFLPFALVELVSGQRIVKNVVGHVLSTEGSFVKRELRLGLTRVALGFPHPIHLGFVSSVAVANAYYIFADTWLKRMTATGLALVMMFMGLSSAPMFSALLQIVMIAWDRIVRVIRGHWVLLVLIGVVTLLVLQLTLPGGLIGYMVNELIFNPYGGQNRIEIFKYGSAEILHNPVLGIGMNEWRRPYWQASTVDNYWLLTAMRFGLPALLLLALAIGASAVRIMGQVGLSEEEVRYRTGYMIALVGTVVVLATVHIWDAPVAFLMAYLGAGAWFYTGQSTAEARLRPVRRRAVAPRTAAERPGLTRGPNPDSQAPPGRRAARAGRRAPRRAASGAAGPCRDPPMSVARPAFLPLPVPDRRPAGRTIEEAPSPKPETEPSC